MGDADSDLTPVSVQGESANGQHQRPSTLSRAGNLTENARSTNSSPSTSAGTTASARATATDRDPQPDTVQHAGTSGQHQQPSTLSPAGNLTENARHPNRSPDTSAGTTASAMVTATDRDPQPAPAQEAGTSAEGQPPGTANPTQFVCPICQGTTFRRDQLKRMRCNHVFHQACIDSWIYYHMCCPLCQTPYRRLRRNMRHKKQRLRYRFFRRAF